MWENASIFALKCTVLFAFLSTCLRSFTYSITGLLAVARHPIPSAKSVWMYFNLYLDFSYATVQAHDPANVMYNYVRLRHSEVWLPTPFSTLPSIYQNSNWPAGLYITNIFMLWKQLLFPLHRLIRHTFPKLQCTYVHGKHCDASNRFHKACTILSHHYWGTYWEIHCVTDEEAVATLCTEKDWWCDLCKRPLFKTTTDCVFFQTGRTLYTNYVCVCVLSINLLISYFIQLLTTNKLYINLMYVSYSIPTSQNIPCDYTGTDLQRTREYVLTYSSGALRISHFYLYVPMTNHTVRCCIIFTDTSSSFPYTNTTKPHGGTSEGMEEPANYIPIFTAAHKLFNNIHNSAKWKPNTTFLYYIPILTASPGRATTFGDNERNYPYTHPHQATGCR